MNDLNERAAFAEVDAALRTAPIASAPPALAPALLARIRALSPAPRFRLTWLDVAIPLFISGTAAALYVLWRSLPPYVTQQIAVRLHIQFLLLSQQAGLPVLGAAVLLSLGLPLAAGLIAMLLFNNNRLTPNYQ